MRGVNKITLLGNVGSDPKMKYTQDGTAIAEISLATTESYKNRAGEKVEETQWHRCRAFGKLAEIIGEYVKKGDPLYLEGSIRYSKYTDAAGVEKYSTEVKIGEMRLIGGKPQTERAPAQERRPAPTQKPATPSFDDVPFDDDIPFNQN